MKKDYVWCAKKLISILPIDWVSVSFSVLIRNCNFNGINTKSKEFKCKCTFNKSDKVIDLVKFYQNNGEVEDLFFEILDFWYDYYKQQLTKENFIMFVLDNDGTYEIKKLELNDNISSRDIDIIINKSLFKNV